MSVDHKPNMREERLRIERAGGMVAWAGTWRVAGVLAVSRAFGDRPLKRFIIPTPDIQEEVLTHKDDCVILATDGVWDVVTNQVHVHKVVALSAPCSQAPTWSGARGASCNALLLHAALRPVLLRLSLSRGAVWLPEL
jgi:serine/threonine protein phosphatase PrpC